MSSEVPPSSWRQDWCGRRHRLVFVVSGQGPWPQADPATGRPKGQRRGGPHPPLTVPLLGCSVAGGRLRLVRWAPGLARQLTMRSLSPWARRAWIAAAAPVGGSVPVAVTVLRPSHEALLTPTIVPPGWHQGSGQLGQHADVYACGGNRRYRPDSTGQRPRASGPSPGAESLSPVIRLVNRLTWRTNTPDGVSRVNCAVVMASECLRAMTLTTRGSPGGTATRSASAGLDRVGRVMIRRCRRATDGSRVSGRGRSTRANAEQAAGGPCGPGGMGQTAH
jgi:hypothetical protein